MPGAVHVSEQIRSKPEQEMTSAEKAAEQVRRLEQERTERVDAGVGLSPGRPVAGAPPPKKIKNDRAYKSGSDRQNRGAANVFASLTSVGYKPSDRALQNTASQAYNGSVLLSRTWLATLFVKLLRANKR